MPFEQHYLAGLDLRGRRVLVVGGGTVAQRRLPRLIASGAAVELVSPSVTPAVQGMVDAGELTWHQRRFQPGDVEGAWYVVACTSNVSVNTQIGEEASSLRVFCVRADIAVEGTAVTPAVGTHDGLVLGVLAGGEHRRSASVRDGLVAALRDGRIADQAAAPVGVALVGGGPGDAELITVKGKRLLAHADVVVADRLAPRELLEELPAHVEVVDAAKIPYGRAATQEFINQTLIDRAKEGKFVVRLKGGDPYVFGRGFEELLACAEAGIPVTVVPGVTSAFGVPALAGVPVTHRGVAHEVVVVSGHVAPDDPRSLVDWPSIARLQGTVVLMMAVERAGAFASALMEGRPGSTPVAVIQEGSTASQRVFRSTLDSLGADVKRWEVRPPAIIVVGPVADIASANS
ncbi:uroporphyrin-III C-methyltransferase [Lentzea aerocolonigenes]|uniref:uroporphyrinogen-III C-methyltransferase n=1 Tax=Lentzea aerocolonigenes TaxID=68170 RepID=A0A0F0HAZ2_LENAE|nr:uroporphyrinogen-III C-methyltransferase [Lentzea aerocolonigenes]KJK51487.1 uroporphyrin-III C-methyltransferase [Lentzea aerocolonigenes]